MANAASSAPTREPARAPLTSPSHSEPVPLATIAAVNAPSSSWPSMAMLITPDLEHTTPVSAPSMIGIDPARVPCSRFTTLNAVFCPASAQHSSETTSRNETTAMATRRSPLAHAARTRAPRRSRSISRRIRSRSAAAGRVRFGTVTLANGWENANVASPW